MTQQYPPDQPPHYGHRQRPRPGPVPPPPKRQPRWPWVVGGFMLLLALIGTVWGNDSGEQTTQNRPGVPSGVNPDTWNAQPHTVSAATAPAAPAQSGPRTSFSSGTYEVGTDIEPGKYKTTGPDSGGSCYWARLKNTNGDLGSIIANGNAQGPTTVTIAKSDAAFETNGCTWTKAG
jgi:hypothetical protein